MRRKVIASAVMALLAASSTWAQKPSGKNEDLEAQLRSMYPWTATKGRAADPVAEGIVLVVKRDGITTNPSIAPFNAPNNYSGGRVRVSAGAILKQDVQTAGRFVPGDRVYVTKTEVKDTSVTVSLLSVEGLQVNGLRAKAAVSFQFPKGYLATANPDDVARMIDELLGMEQPPPQQQAPPPPLQRGQQNPLRGPAPPPQRPAESNEAPPTIELGMNYDQVRAVLGNPTRIADIGEKKIYFYPNLKVTFVSGVVKDVD